MLNLPPNHFLFKDIYYYIIAEPADYHVDFKIYRVTGFRADKSGEFTVPLFESDDDPFFEGVDNANIFASGVVKWDGCSNWNFDECERVMIHHCDRRGLVNIGEVLARCWDLTATLCPNFDKTAAG